MIELDGEAIGKPSDAADAAAILSRLSNRTHMVTTGVCLIRRSDFLWVRFCERSFVRFKKLSMEEIAHYLALVDVLDKAGAYAVQEHGSLLIESIEGSRTNIVGLPLERLREALDNIDGFRS